MRILIITFDPPENIGGVEGRAIGYTKGLLAKGHGAIIIAFGKKYDFGTEPFCGTRLYRYSSHIGSFLASFRRLIAVATVASVRSVFVLSGATTFQGTAIILFCRLSRRRSSIFLYGKDILVSRRSLPQRAFLSLSELLADVIVTNSRYTTSLLPRFLRAKSRVLYPSIDPSVLGDEAPPLNSERRRILFVGRLVKRKGVDDLLDACKLLSEDLPGIRLEVVGDGPERRRLEGIASDLSLGRLVTFRGALRGKALFECYRNCDVFAMPSKTLDGDVEGFGTVFLEAGLFGKPSAGTYSGGIREAVLDGVTGILVKEGDVPALAKALKTLLEDRDLARKFGDNARKRVLEAFTWQDGTNTLLKILEGNASESGP